MFKKEQKKNYLELTVRVSYDEKTDSINITSKDKRLPADSDGFRLTLNGGRNAEQALRTMLEEEGLIPEEKILPETVSYDDIADTWSGEFPLGKFGGKETASWTPAVSPNLLITGPTGSGTSAIERTLIFHCLQHPDKWQIVGIDLRRVELRPYEKYSSVIRIAKDLEEAVETCRYVRDEMMKRYEKMEELVVNHHQDLPDAPPAIMFLIDEVGLLLTPCDIDSETGRKEDELKGEAAMILTEISRLGRAAGVHLVLTAQRPQGILIPGVIKATLTTKIVMGRVDSIHSQVVLGTDEATRLPKIKGRGYLQNGWRGGEPGKQFQAAWADYDWFDKRLEKKTNHDGDSAK